MSNNFSDQKVCALSFHMKILIKNSTKWFVESLVESTKNKKSQVQSTWLFLFLSLPDQEVYVEWVTNQDKPLWVHKMKISKPFKVGRFLFYRVLRREVYAEWGTNRGEPIRAHKWKDSIYKIGSFFVSSEITEQSFRDHLNIFYKMCLFFQAILR